jgi:hypothetical protein
MVNKIAGRFTSFLVASLLLFLFVPQTLSAAQLTNRSLAVGSSLSSASTTHEFTFDFPSTDDVGSIEFLYCDDPLRTQPCNAPAGLDASGASLASQSGETGFSIQSASTSRIVLSRPSSAASLVSGNYEFGNVTNPSAEETFYVRIFTYQSEDGTGTADHHGTVVSSTSTGINIETEVPEILNFCVAKSIPVGCNSASGNFLKLGELKSSTTATATSQMVGGTNADFGYVITVNGQTMTSGNNVIKAMHNKAPSVKGQAQFGINLRANSSPSVGKNPSGPGIATPASAYNTPNLFRFRDGNVVASSPDETNVKKFTISYIVNVPASQSAGIYNTTITYVCVATF